MVEGRLEMCVDGVWGIALLFSSSSIETANVACRQLGFSAKGLIFCHNKAFDPATACTYIQPAEYYHIHHLEMEMVLLCTQKFIVMEMKNHCLTVGCLRLQVSIVLHTIDIIIPYPFGAQMLRIEL